MIADTITINKQDPITGYTPFHTACAGGQLSIVKQLMTQYGNDTCKQLLSRDGKTGLQVSAESGHQRVVQTIPNTINIKNLRLII